MNTRIFKMAVVAGFAIFCASSYSQWLPTGTTTTDAKGRTGNVGIGITNPSAQLNVKSIAANKIPLVVSSASNPSEDIAQFQNNGASKVVVRSSGSVGIGTTNPTNALLEVQGGSISAIYGATSLTSNQAGVTGYSSAGTGVQALSDNGNALAAVCNGGNAIYGSSHSGYAGYFIGNVYCTNVVQAASIKINNWTISAPDYVFDKRYNLPSLKEVEKKISADKHLPGVPSAVEMKKNGVDLSQLNMTLLKKVEELTLYAIEQNKKIESQNKRIENLEKRVAR